MPTTSSPALASTAGPPLPSSRERHSASSWPVSAATVAPKASGSSRSARTASLQGPAASSRVTGGREVLHQVRRSSGPTWTASIVSVTVSDLPAPQRGRDGVAGTMTGVRPLPMTR